MNTRADEIKTHAVSPLSNGDNSHCPSLANPSYVMIVNDVDNHVVIIATKTMLLITTGSRQAYPERNTASFWAFSSELVALYVLLFDNHKHGSNTSTTT